jgi:hypothetical protein
MKIHLASENSQNLFTRVFKWHHSSLHACFIFIFYLFQIQLSLFHCLPMQTITQTITYNCICYFIMSKCYLNISAQTFRTSYCVAHYLKVNNITAISCYPFLTLIIHLYNNRLKLNFFFQIIIIIDLNYVSFSKLPFNNNETNFQIEQIVLLISIAFQCKL